MTPNAELYNASPDYIRALVEKAAARHGISQRKLSKLLGIPWGTLENWKSGRSRHSYADQYLLEMAGR